MNKKVLSAILFGALMAGTGTFTSCIDNDAPAGIEELRGAKAELIRAKIAVEEANALAIAADAALTQAKAETEKAVAAYQKALADQQAEKVKQEALRTELQAATNEADKARLQAEIAEAAARQAKAEASMVEAAKQHELNMKNMETSLLQYELAYQNALKDLKLAEVTLTANQQAAVEAIKKEINGYYVAGKTYYVTEWIYNPNTEEWEKSTNKESSVEGYYVDGLMDILVEAEQNLFDAQKKLYVAMNKKEAGNDVAEAEFAVKVAEHNLADAKAAAAKVAELAAKEIASTDWEKEAADLAEEVKAIDVELKGLAVEREKLAAANKEKFDTLMMAKDAVTDALDNSGEGYPVAKYENKTIAENTAAKAWIPAMNGYSNGVFKYGADDQTFVLQVNADGTFDKGVAGNHLAMVENWIEKLGEVEIDENTPAKSELLLNGAQTAVTTAQTAFEKAVAEWTIAKNAFANGTFVAVPTTEYQAVVTAYNTNVEALAAAITAYNAKYTELYAAGEEAKVEETKAEMYDNYYLAAMQIELGKIDTKYGTTLKAASESLTALSKEKQISTTEELFAEYHTGATADEKAEYAKGLAAAQDKATRQVNSEVALWDEEKLEEVIGTAGVDAVKKAIGKDKDLTVAKKGITDAAAKLTATKDKAGSYAALTEAMKAYAKLVEVPYAQALTAAAEEAAAGMTANATYAAKTAGVTVDDEAYASVYEIKTSTITAEEFTAATATKKLEGEALKNVWAEASKNAFGYDDRIVETTEVKAGDTESALYKLDQAQKNLKNVQDAIAVGETLTALVAELTAQKAVLEAEIAVATEAYAAAKAIYDAKEETYNKIFAEIEEEVEALKHEKATANRVMTTLNGVVSCYLNGLNYKYTDVEGVEHKFEFVAGEDNTARLKHFFEEWTLDQEARVLAEEGEVKEAKAFLAMVKEGKYDAVAMETRLVEKAQAAYDFAKANMDAAVERLAALLDSFDAE